MREVVPPLFKLFGSVRFPVSPEEGYHFPKGGNIKRKVLRGYFRFHDALIMICEKDAVSGQPSTMNFQGLSGVILMVAPSKELARRIESAAR